MNDLLLNGIRGLKWLPWIGSEYFSRTSRLLIVGESHYAENDPLRLKEFESRQITRECVEDMGVNNNKYNVKFYQNIHHILTETNNPDTKKLWSRVAFYNYIQKTMIDSKTRPTSIDFQESSETFFELLEKIEPRYCLLCGISSLNAIRSNLPKSNFAEVAFEKLEKVSRIHPRKLSIKLKGGLKSQIDLLFIQHPSHHFSSRKWGNVLKSTFPEVVNA